MSNNSNTLVDEKLAVSLFLDSLLRETEDVPEVVTPELKVAVEPTKVEIPPVVNIPVAKVKTEVKVDAPEIIIPEVITPKIKQPLEEIQQEEVVAKVEAPLKEEAESLVPEWANEPFQVLLFEVAGLKLAVPLIELCGVIEWNDSVTEMPGHADFYLGILQHLDHKIAIIDTAKMVLPVNKQTSLIGEDPRDRVKHIVMIDDFQWGLACDTIGEVITLNPEEVRWRTSNTTRSWLAGTVIEHMCALLNSEGFSTMLKKGQQAGDI